MDRRLKTGPGLLERLVRALLNLPAARPRPSHGGPSAGELESGAGYQGGHAPSGAPSLPCRHCGKMRIGGHIPVTEAGTVVYYCHDGEPGTERTTWDPAL